MKPLRGDSTSHKAMILLGPWLLPSTCIFAANFLFNCIVMYRKDSSCCFVNLYTTHTHPVLGEWWVLGGGGWWVVAPTSQPPFGGVM